MSDAEIRPEGLWLGHPKGLFFLAFTETWERFSFYGMRALLILYMVQELLVSDRVDQVAGMPAYRSVIESIFGQLSTQAFASQTFGLYAGFVYFTPLFGGLIADRWLGAKRTVLIGIALMTAGHFAMVFDWSFLLALLLLVLGSGCLKGNIAAQVGQLYPKAEDALRSRGYTVFSTGINVGAVIGPLACGALAQAYGWHVGFGTAGVMMLLAAVIYLSGLRHFAEGPAHAKAGQATALSGVEWRMIAMVMLALALLLFQFLAFEQIFNVGLIWIADHVELAASFGEVPPAWFTAEDSFASIVIVPVLMVLWRALARQGREPGDFGKLALGAAVMSCSALALAAGAMSAQNGAKVSIVWPMLAFFLSGTSFMISWPTMLALVSRRSPAKISALMMAGAYLVPFGAGIGSGFIARWYEPMGPANFWLLNVAIAVSGVLAFLLFGPLMKRRMDRLDVLEGQALQAA